MNNKIDQINTFLYNIELHSKINKITPDNILKKILNYNLNLNEEEKDIKSNLEVMLQKYGNNKKINISEEKDFFILKNKDFNNNNSYNVKLNIPLKLYNCEVNISNIIDFMIKNKLLFCAYISKQFNNNILSLVLLNKEDANKIIKYLNSNKKKTIKFNNNNIFTHEYENVNFLIEKNYNLYFKYLSIFICDYFSKTSKDSDQIDVNQFLKYLNKHIDNLNLKYDLSDEINLINKYSLGKNIAYCLGEIKVYSNLIYDTLNNLGNDVNLINLYYDKCNEYNNKTAEFDNFTKDNFLEANSLMKEIIKTMSNKYGYNYAKEALIKYKKSIKNSEQLSNNSELCLGYEYITRENNLREKVKKSPIFRTFINCFTNEEFEDEFNRLKPIEIKNDDVISDDIVFLEEVCKQTFNSCQTPERNFVGKMQVARGLIKIQENNFDCITRNNNARLLASNKLKDKNIKEILKKYFENQGFILEKETDIYELYANHIEFLCNNERKINSVRKN